MSTAITHDHLAIIEIFADGFTHVAVAPHCKDYGGDEEGYEDDEGEGDQHQSPLQPAPLVPPGNILDLHLHRLLHGLRSFAQSCSGLLPAIHYCRGGILQHVRTRSDIALLV